MTLKFKKIRNKKPLATKWPDANGNTYDVLVAEFEEVTNNSLPCLYTYNARNINRLGRNNPNNFLQRLIWDNFNKKIDLSNMTISNAIMSFDRNGKEFFQMLGQEIITI